MNYKHLIIDQITRLNVVSSSQLALNVMSATNPLTFNKNKYDESLDDLLESGEIVSLYFNPPNSGTRVLYFPKETTFNFNAVRVRPRSEEREEWKEKYGLEP